MEGVVAVFTAFLVAAVPLALLVTKAVDLARNLFDKADSAPKWVWNVVAFIVGLVICLGWQFNYVTALADAVPALSGSTTLDGVAGQIITGLSVGAMASFWHEKLDQWSSVAKTNKAEMTQV